MCEPVAWISVLSFQTVVVRILHFSGLVYRPTLPAYTGRAVVVCCILDQETAIRSQVVSKIADLKVKKTYETQIRQIVPNGETWKPVVHDTQSLKYRCQSVSITAENDCVLAASTLSQVPVPVQDCYLLWFNHCFVTLCIDILRTFSIIRVFYFFVLLIVHLCAIDTRFNKCNLLIQTNSPTRSNFTTPAATWWPGEYDTRLDWIVQCFKSPPTQYRLYGRRFLQVKRPNQQYQSTEGDATTEKAKNENN